MLKLKMSNASWYLKFLNSRMVNVNLNLKLSDDDHRAMEWLGALPLGSGDKYYLLKVRQGFTNLCEKWAPGFN